MNTLSLRHILFHAIIMSLALVMFYDPAFAARDVKNELQNIQKQRQMVKKAQANLAKQLGDVGNSLKKLDQSLLKARHAYRQVRKDIKTVDKHLLELAAKKKVLQKSMEKLHQQMLNEASAAYQHAGSRSVWVDMLSGVSITEMPHRQYLLKAAMVSQENDRKLWHDAMAKLAVVEQEEQENKNKLLSLQEQRKNAERELVSQVGKKKDAAKQLRSDLNKQKAQDRRLAKQEKALQALLNGLGDTLLASDKKISASSIRKQKGKMPWPLKGRVVVGFHHQTKTG